VWRLSIQALQNKARDLGAAAKRLSDAFGASQASTK
jgi:hypothetical protein